MTRAYKLPSQCYPTKLWTPVLLCCGQLYVGKMKLTPRPVRSTATGHTSSPQPIGRWALALEICKIGIVIYKTDACVSLYFYVELADSPSSGLPDLWSFNRSKNGEQSYKPGRSATHRVVSISLRIHRPWLTENLDFRRVQ